MTLASEKNHNGEGIMTNKAEKVWIQYFSYGDLGFSRHGKKIRLETSTTHPAQIELIRRLMNTHAKPIIYPYKTGATYGWRIVCYVDQTFGFLISERRDLHPDLILDDRLFYSALSGFADADGHIGLRKVRKLASAIFTLSNRNKELLLGFKVGLEKRGFTPGIYSLHSKNSTVQYQLELRGRNAMKLFLHLEPKHAEKSEALNLALKHYGQDWSIAGAVYRDFRNSIRKGRDLFIAEAKSKYPLRGLVKEERRSTLMEKVRSAQSMRLHGLEIGTIAEKSHRSRRTIYRWLRLRGNESDIRNKEETKQANSRN